ncbi:TPA: hypothetical protein ACP2S9_004611, partial [Escherichia coli]
MKLIIFILIVLIIAALLIRIILRSVNQHSPLLMQLHAAGGFAPIFPDICYHLTH